MEASQADAGQQSEGTESATEAFTSLGNEGPQEQGQQEPKQQQGQQIPDDVMSRLDALGQEVQQLRGGDDDEGDYEGEEGEEGFEDEPDSNYLYNEFGDPIDPQTGQMVDPDQIAAQELQQHINGQVTEAVQQAIAPLLEQQQNQQIQQEAEALEQEFPALATPEGAEQALNQAREHAKAMGDDTLASNPSFVRLVHLAGLAEQAAVGQTPAGATQEAVAVEGGGGAAPAGQVEDDTAQRILKAGSPNGGVLGGLA